MAVCRRFARRLEQWQIAIKRLAVQNICSRSRASMVYKSNQRVTFQLLRPAMDCLQLHAVMPARIAKRFIQ
jgi:hypothetical protein